jgi:hypothetical protein
MLLLLLTAAHTQRNRNLQPIARGSQPMNGRDGDELNGLYVLLNISDACDFDVLSGLWFSLGSSDTDVCMLRVRLTAAQSHLNHDQQAAAL